MYLVFGAQLVELIGKDLGGVTFLEEMYHWGGEGRL